jgi:hypothetical protein
MTGKGRIQTRTLPAAVIVCRACNPAQARCASDAQNAARRLWEVSDMVKMIEGREAAQWLEEGKNAD